MASHKATYNRLFSMYLFLLVLFLFLSLLLKNAVVDILSVVFSIVPFFLILKDTFIRRFSMSISPFVFFSMILLGIFYKFGRIFFSNPQINKDSIVGYAHFYGYPLYFDHIVFFLFIAIPVVATIYFMIKNKIR